MRQRAADLLADGREFLERWCRSTRFAHLYPEGPNLSILFEAYQEFDRRRTIGRAPRSRWRQRRALVREIRKAAKRDALIRNQRIQWQVPTPRLTAIAPMPAFDRALLQVDADVRSLLRARLSGLPEPGLDPSISQVTDVARQHRAYDQFREALANEVLAHPEALLRLPAAIWPLLATAPPTRRRYPIATLIFIKFPLRLAAAVLALLIVSYVGAWMVFNDAVLGRFVSTQVSGLVEGDLELGSIHWDLPLIVDLATGRPTRVVVRDVSVWEPYKSYGGQRRRRTAHAERLDATLVLHEIIPWNRMGIPRLFDIPWVLHFPTVRTDEATWITVREYEDVDDEGNPATLLSLIDAFSPLDPNPDNKGLSFAVDDATLATTTVEVDIGGDEGWGNASQFSWVNFELSFDAPPPHTEVDVLPFAYSIEAFATQGRLRIGELSVPYEDLAVDNLSTGRGDVALGDLGFVATTRAAGTTLALSGGLGNAFAGDVAPVPALTTELRAETDDADGLVEHLLDELALPRETLGADGASLFARVWGPVDAPQYQLRGEGLTLDVLGESAWAVDDLVVDLTLRQDTLDPRWQDRPDADAPRRVARFDALRGVAMEGSLDLAGPDAIATVVFPRDATEPWLIAADLSLDGVNPGHLFPADPTLAARMTGTLDGLISVHELVIPQAPVPDAGPNAPDIGVHDTSEAPAPRVDLELFDMSLVRDRGPKQDGLPRKLQAQGRIIYDPQTGLDLKPLVVSTDGTRLTAEGGVDAGFSTLRDTTLALRIDDGRAFARAFALDTYFAGLRADLVVGGQTGAPRSAPGRLLIDRLGVLSGGAAEPLPDQDDPDAPTGGGRTTQASIWLERGVLRVRSTDTRMFGGRGTVDLWVHLFQGGALASDPKVRGKIRLRGVRPGPLTQGQVTGVMDADITLDDGHGRPASLDKLEASGLVAAGTMRVAGTTYRDARMLFTLSPEALEIEQLVLPLHRAISPFHGPSVTIPVGEVVARGTVSLDRDPALDLVVGARGVPLDVVARLLDVDAPVGGRIGPGTELDVGGTLARPRVDGTVNFVGLAAGGVVLGGGALQIQSADFPRNEGIAAHREVRIGGDLSAADTGQGALEWHVEAVAAFGAAARDGSAPVDAEVEIGLDSLSLASIIGDPVEAGLPSTVRGAVEGLGAHITTCDGSAPMLSSCRDHVGSRSLQVDLEVERTWLSADGTPTAGGEPPCDEQTTLCSDTRLDATLDWPLLTLDRQWRLSTGGKSPATLAISGSLDLSTAQIAERKTASDCRPPPLGSTVATSVTADPSKPQAQIAASLELASLAPILKAYGLTTADGRIDLDLSLSGRMPEPSVAGRATLATKAGGVAPLSMQLAGVELPLTFSELDVRLGPGWLTAAGHVDVEGETVEFGSVRGEHTGVGLSGDCAGHWGVAAQGTLSNDLLEAFAGRGLAPRGSVTLDRLVLTGPGQDDDPIDRVEGTARLRRQSLALELSESVPTVELTDGRIDFARCRGDECGPTVTPGSLAIWLGGKDAAMPKNRARTGEVIVPKDALQARVGSRGRASAWGVTHLPLDISHAEATAIRAVLTDVSYHDYDGRGRPVYEMEVSSDDLLLQGGDPLVLSGTVTADRARYVKDAVQGVEILTLTDEIEVPEAPPPAILRALQFDLRAQTDSPLRVENNIAHGVEADVALKISGNYVAPELSGRFDVEPGGTVDIPFLTGTYEIQFGRVTLEREIGDAEVDILALRNEPVYIDNQARQIQLLLGGTVSAITWNCIAEGDVSGALETSRGCLDYLVLGAGDEQIGQADVQRLGGGGLANARKSLQVVGHVTEFDFGERIEEAAPRYESFVPDVRLRLGQIGPELDIATPPEWLDFDWARVRFGWDYTRGYPGFLLLQSRELSLQVEILDPVTLEFSRDIRSYLNERIIFDPLRQRTLELRFDFSVPSLR